MRHTITQREKASGTRHSRYKNWCLVTTFGLWRIVQSEPAISIVISVCLHPGTSAYINTVPSFSIISCMYNIIRTKVEETVINNYIAIRKQLTLKITIMANFILDPNWLLICKLATVDRKCAQQHLGIYSQEHHLVSSSESLLNVNLSEGKVHETYTLNKKMISIYHHVEHVVWYFI